LSEAFSQDCKAKEGGLAALENALDNPAGAFITSAIKGWLEAESNQ
jgi:hypothetical protein